MLEKAGQGIWPSSAPLGYRNVVRADGKRIIEVDPEKGPLIAKMFDRYARGDVSVKDLAGWAKKQGLTYRRSHAELPVSSVHRLLCNLIYTGDFIWDGKTYKGTHTPLITRETWERVQEKLEGRSHFVRRERNHTFLFSGLVRCGTCAAAGGSDRRLLIGEIQKQRLIYYHCAGCAHQKRAQYVKEEVLDKQFHDALRGLRLDDEVLGLLRDGLRLSHEESRRFHEEATARLYKQHEALQRRIDTAYEDRLDGRITADMFDRKAAEWRGEQAKVRRELETQDVVSQAYIEQGLALLTLMARAADLYPSRSLEQKRRLLHFALLNAAWSDGKLKVTWRFPFNLLAQSISECRSAPVESVATADAHSQWRPRRESNARPRV